MVSMAHPKFAGGRSFDDMRHLVGYEFTEVLNHYRISDEYWDQALSAGRLTWIMGDDDTHDIVKEPTFRIWNIIYSNFRHSDSIMNSMKMGMNYGIASLNQACDNDLVSCQLDKNDNIHIKLTNVADSILISGQDGVILKRIYNSDTVDYSFKESDTYIRTVAYNANSDLYMNPILRFDGVNVPLNVNVKATPSFILTWLFRIAAVLISLLLLLFILKIIRYK